MKHARCECCRTVLIATAEGRLMCPNATCPRPTTQLTLEETAA